MPDPSAPRRRAPTPTGPRPSNPYLYAAAVVLAVAVLLGLQGPSGPTPEASAQPTATAAQSITPDFPVLPPPLANPEHLTLKGPAGFFIGSAWVTVDLPPATEADYYPGRLLEAGSPRGGITITSASSLSNQCLTPPAPTPDAAAELEPPPGKTPGVGAASGSTFVLDGYTGRYLEFTRASGTCHPNYVWDTFADGIGGRGLNVRLQLWILDVADQYLVLGSYASIDEDAATLEGTRKIVASVRVQAAEAAFSAGALPAGPVAPGWYSVVADNRTDQSPPGFDPLNFVLHIPNGGWTATGSVRSASGWQLEHGAPPDGAVVRIGRVDGVYSNPCSHEQAPPPGSSASALADAVAAIPGVEIVERSRGRSLYSAVEYVSLTIPAQIPCALEDFFLWYDEIEGPRAPTAAGSTIRLWVFTPNDRDVFGRLVFEAESPVGADPPLDSEVLQMFYSIQYGG